MTAEGIVNAALGRQGVMRWQLRRHAMCVGWPGLHVGKERWPGASQQWQGMTTVAGGWEHLQGRDTNRTTCGHRAPHVSVPARDGLRSCAKVRRHRRQHMRGKYRDRLSIEASRSHLPLRFAGSRHSRGCLLLEHHLARPQLLFCHLTFDCTRHKGLTAAPAVTPMFSN